MTRRSRNKLGEQGLECDYKGRSGWEGKCVVNFLRAAINKVSKPRA